MEYITEYYDYVALQTEVEAIVDSLLADPSRTDALAVRRFQSAEYAADNNPKFAKLYRDVYPSCNAKFEDYKVAHKHYILGKGKMSKTEYNKKVSQFKTAQRKLAKALKEFNS